MKGLIITSDPLIHTIEPPLPGVPNPRLADLSGPSFGLKELVSGNDPDVDIVAIHSLNGHREKSWTAENNVLWLRDLLPAKIPNARILAYGYNAYTHGQERLTPQYMLDHAMTFLSKLVLYRKETSAEERPIIFIAHGIGGIMLKAALIQTHFSRKGHLYDYSSIMVSTFGILFMATPHQGAIELCNSIIRVRSLFAKTNDVLLRYIEKDSEALQQQLMQYISISGNFVTKFFYETERVPGASKLVVPKPSAMVPGALDVESIGLNKDHVNMIRYESAEDSDFQVVSSHLFFMAKAAPQTITDKWELHKKREDSVVIDYTAHADLLEKLPRAKDAAYNCGYRASCWDGTRTEVIRAIEKWRDTRTDTRIYYMKGLAGIGKTTIAQSFAISTAAQGLLGASFFCSRNSADRSNLDNIFRTIAFQLCHHPRLSVYRGGVLRALRDNPDVGYTSMKEQLERLIVSPFKNLTLYPPVIVIVDALDECKDDSSTSAILSLLSDYTQSLSAVKFFLTSRPESHIRQGLQLQPLMSLTHVFILHDVGLNTVQGDIRIFITGHLANAAKRSDVDLTMPWPSEEDIQALVAKAAGLFIFASTACKFILDKDEDPQERLDVVVRMPGIKLEIDRLYEEIFKSATVSLSDKSMLHFRLVLGAVLFIFDPMTMMQLSRFLQLKLPLVRRALKSLHSVIMVPNDDGSIIYPFHASLRDYLTNCSGHKFHLTSSDVHAQLTLQSLDYMLAFIEEEMPKSQDHEDLERPWLVGVELRYSCLYWADHLSRIDPSLFDGRLLGILESFVSDHSFHWIECHLQLGELRRVIKSSQLAQDWICRTSAQQSITTSGLIDGLYHVVYSDSTYNPRKPKQLHLLGIVMLDRFRYHGHLSDLQNSISALEDALRVTPYNHPNRAARQSNLALALLRRFERLGELTDLDESISSCEDAINLTQNDDPDKACQLNQLGNSFLRRFERLGELSDLERAISACTTAVEIMPLGLPVRPGYLISIGDSYLRRFERLGRIPDLEQSISVCEVAVQRSSNTHPDKPRHLFSLGKSFLLRFARLGELSDIEKSISVCQQALELTPEDSPDRPGYLDHLGNSFLKRFERLGSLADLEGAVSACQKAVYLTPDDHPDKAQFLRHLGNVFLRRFKHLGQLHDLQDSNSSNETAAALTPDDHPDKPCQLHHLAHSFLVGFEQSGIVAYLEKAILLLEQALQLTPDGHPEKPNRLILLSESSLRRFDRFGELLDLEQSIIACKNAVNLVHDDHPDKCNHLFHLGNSLLRRFERLGGLSDLEDTIFVYERAVELTPNDHPIKATYLHNLSNSFFRRFETFGEFSDLDKSISLIKLSLELTPEGHINKPECLNHLGTSLFARFKQSSSIHDLEQSIQNCGTAVYLTPDSHPQKARYLDNLGRSYLERFERLKTSPDINKAISLFSHAAHSTSSYPLVRFHAARRWAHSTLSIGASPLPAFSYALELLPSVVWLGLTVANRHRIILELDSVVQDAAASAISAGEYATAIEWLEQGRCIVWGQLLQFRSPVDDLQAKEPELAAQLLKVSMDLERKNAEELAADPNSLAKSGEARYRLASDWDKLVERVRMIPGFESFLQPRKIAQLAIAAESGPVILLNIHSTRCDALILRYLSGQADVSLVPLEDLSYAKVKAMKESMDRLQSRPSPLASTRHVEILKEFVGDPDMTLQEILATLWTSVAKPVLDSLALPVSCDCDPPRIWWCPTGPLVFLPIHAAGHYFTQEAGSKIFDFVISSYTPTITALLHPPRPNICQPFKLLAVSQASTPGYVPLPFTEEELTSILHHAGDKFQAITLRGREATVDRVLEGMMECSWVHFSCHGIQDPAKPMRSSFLFSGGKLELSKISLTHLPHANFAFLSACHSAVGHEELVDEAIHLAAGMLLAGYRSIIATLWPIEDEEAFLIADSVYAELFKCRQPDHTRTAQALHHAVQQLRARGSPLRRWIPFIHIGM